MANSSSNNRTQIPNWFPVDSAREAFAASYPFHPALLSVFERKWQALPRFQQTRGILRLLALWVSHAYQAGFKGAHKDPLIGMGTAPLDDPMFRSAIFEQLGGAKLEGAVTTDICGKKDSHAVRLDKEAVETIKKARLHQKVATVDLLRVERRPVEDGSHSSGNPSGRRRTRHRDWEYRNGSGDTFDNLLLPVRRQESVSIQPDAESKQDSRRPPRQRPAKEDRGQAAG